jgi:hypothetical protein
MMGILSKASRTKNATAAIRIRGGQKQSNCLRFRRLLRVASN